LHKPILGPSAACFPLCGRDQHVKQGVTLARADAAGGARQHHRRVARGKLNLASQMRSSEFPRLCYNESNAVVAVSKQIVVAKEESWAKCRSDGVKFGEDRLHRGTKRRARQGLEINPKAAPSVLLPPFSNWITLHSHPPLAAEVASTGFRRDPLTVDSQPRDL
jgi:hypothetical protein